jgi:hypothetical protein
MTHAKASQPFQPLHTRLKYLANRWSGAVETEKGDTSLHDAAGVQSRVCGLDRP